MCSQSVKESKKIIGSAIKSIKKTKLIIYTEYKKGEGGGEEWYSIRQTMQYVYHNLPHLGFDQHREKWSCQECCLQNLRHDLL